MDDNTRVDAIAQFANGIKDLDKLDEVITRLLVMMCRKRIENDRRNIHERERNFWKAQPIH